MPRQHFPSCCSQPIYEMRAIVPGFKEICIPWKFVYPLQLQSHMRSTDVLVSLPLSDKKRIQSWCQFMSNLWLMKHYNPYNGRMFGYICSVPYQISPPYFLFFPHSHLYPSLVEYTSVTSMNSIIVFGTSGKISFDIVDLPPMPTSVSNDCINFLSG